MSEHYLQNDVEQSIKSRKTKNNILEERKLVEWNGKRKIEVKF